MLNFNFWWVITPMTTLLAPIVGYYTIGLRSRKALCTIYATLTAIIFGYLLVAESYLGIVQFLGGDREPLSFLVAPFAIAFVAMFYGALQQAIALAPESKRREAIMRINRFNRQHQKTSHSMSYDVAKSISKNERKRRAASRRRKSAKNIELPIGHFNPRVSRTKIVIDMRDVIEVIKRSEAFFAAEAAAGRNTISYTETVPSYTVSSEEMPRVI